VYIDRRQTCPTPGPHSALVRRGFIQHVKDPVVVKAGKGRGARNKAHLLSENSSANAKPPLKAISKAVRNLFGQLDKRHTSSTREMYNEMNLYKVYFVSKGTVQQPFVGANG
jgi:hypothetical protein